MSWMNLPPTSPETRRLFFALWPDDALRLKVARWLAEVQGLSGRPVAMENWHLTLCFIGGTDVNQQQCLEQAANAITDIPSFELILDQYGYWHRPRVFWLGGQSPEPLYGLVGQLRAGMSACGMAPETRGFVSHMTLLRKVGHAPDGVLNAPISWQVADFVLVSSNTRPQGVEYQVLRRWLLAAPPGHDLA